MRRVKLRLYNTTTPVLSYKLHYPPVFTTLLILDPMAMFLAKALFRAMKKMLSSEKLVLEEYKLYRVLIEHKGKKKLPCIMIVDISAL